MKRAVLFLLLNLTICAIYAQSQPVSQRLDALLNDSAVPQASLARIYKSLSQSAGVNENVLPRTRRLLAVVHIKSAPGRASDVFPALSLYSRLRLMFPDT
jgi:hypothetical protein